MAANLSYSSAAIENQQLRPNGASSGASNMSSLQSRERAQVNEAVEVFSKLEGEIRELVCRDATAPRLQPDNDNELAAGNVGSLLQRVSGISVQEIEKLMAELQILRDMLQNEAARVQREIVEYVVLMQGARQSMRTISESLSFWKNDRDIPRVSACPSVAKCRAEFVGSKGVRRFRVDALIASICVVRLRNPHDAGLHPHGIGRRVVCTSDRYRRTDLPFVNDAERSRALHTSLSRTSHMDQNLERLIRERAYEIWASRGCVHGQADQHWLAAEREILTASTAAFAGKAAPQKKRPLPARSKITKTLARSG
jgi:hypothetical protein